MGLPEGAKNKLGRGAAITTRRGGGLRLRPIKGVLYFVVHTIMPDSGRASQPTWRHTCLTISMSPGVRTSKRACGETANEAFDLMATKSLLGIDLFHTLHTHRQRETKKTIGQQHSRAKNANVRPIMSVGLARLKNRPAAHT